MQAHRRSESQLESLVAPPVAGGVGPWRLQRASGSVLFDAAASIQDDDKLAPAIEELGEAIDLVYVDPPYVAHKWSNSIGAQSEISVIERLRRLQHVAIQATNGGPQGIDLIFFATLVNQIDHRAFLLVCPVNVTRTKRRAAGDELGFNGVRDRLRKWASRIPNANDRVIGERLLRVLELASSATQLRDRGVPLIWFGLELRHRHDEVADLISAAPSVADTPVCKIDSRGLYNHSFRPWMGPSTRRSLLLASRDAFDCAFLTGFSNLLCEDLEILSPFCGNAGFAHWIAAKGLRDAASAPRQASVTP